MEVERSLIGGFLNTQDGKGRAVYLDAIRNMCAANWASLEVQWQDLKENLDQVAGWMIEAPKDMLEIFDEVCNLHRRQRHSYWSCRRLFLTE